MLIINIKKKDNINNFNYRIPLASKSNSDISTTDGAESLALSNTLYK